jgi:hypothetical protein
MQTGFFSGDKPKVCFVKQTYIVNGPWKSLRYPGPEKMLGALPWRSQNYAFFVGMETDFWVTKGRETSRMYRHIPDELSMMREAHKNVVAWGDIPWDEYDIVISYEPIIPDEIILAHPKILWVYHEPSHRSGRSQQAAAHSGGVPLGAYDLFWDDFMRPTKELKQLPQSISFPYFAHPTILKDAVKPTNERAVFVDSRHTWDIDENERARLAREWQSLCGLPIRYAPGGKITLGRSHRRLLVDGEMLQCRQYLELLGSCKYKLVWRKKQVGGQAAIEAASLGLIVVANSNGVYHKMLCHPFCLIPPGGPARTALRKVQKIEANQKLQAEILHYQDRMLMKKFWHPGLAILHDALEMKRR